MASQPRLAFSLLELLAALTIVGVLAVIVAPRIGTGAKVSQAASCDVNAGVIEVQVSLWRHKKGDWPASTLVDIGADTDFFPEGLPTCPVDDSAYQIDLSTGHVVGHSH
ncbi:type II secretion system protein [Planctomycetes bacterium K23_9]|uniref:Prepilin-type N-terminal cleavage/methylation domain-containing protein n=1 Tax=Stieleria marina TaxID=1930275 RepID=A0A517NWC8_9BACT|nr:hypothetical protein K239x_34280 [Planctomycetes bacterium K23_9]